jgi:dTMP kinase
MEGKLVTFEGIDNSGKTTIAQKLISELLGRGIHASFAGERSTQVGPLLRRLGEFSPFEKTLLFAADRALLLERAKPLLERGTHVIFDRYYHSAIAYRTAEDFDPEYVRLVNKKFRVPDLAILLDIEVDLSIKRHPPEKPQTPYDSRLLERVRKAYLAMVETDGLRRVDASGSLNSVFDNVFTLVLDTLNK